MNLEAGYTRKSIHALVLKIGMSFSTFIQLITSFKIPEEKLPVWLVQLIGSFLDVSSVGR